MATKAKEQRKNGSGRAKVDDLSRYYANRWSDVKLDEQKFRVVLLHGTQGHISLDNVVETLSWVDDDVLLSGSMQLRNPRPSEPRLPFTLGTLIRCDVKWAGKFVELWQMRVDKPVDSLEDGSISVDLVDRLAYLQRSHDSFNYKRNKHHKPKGWYCHEIVRDVAKRYGIPIGQLAEGTKRIRSLVTDGSPLDVIKKAYGLEREWSGRRYTIRFMKGKMYIQPLRRNPVVYIFGQQIISGTVERHMDPFFASVLEVEGSSKKKGRKRHKIKHTEIRPDLVKRFGYIKRKRSLEGLDSHAEAKTRAKRIMAKHSYPKRTINISHPGISVLRRGDCERISIPDEGFVGKKSFVFCKSVSHSVSNGVYTMDVDFTVEDPFINARAELEAALKKQKHDKRKGKK